MRWNSVAVRGWSYFFILWEWMTGCSLSHYNNFSLMKKSSSDLWPNYIGAKSFKFWHTVLPTAFSLFRRLSHYFQILVSISDHSAIILDSNDLKLATRTLCKGQSRNSDGITAVYIECYTQYGNWIPIEILRTSRNTSTIKSYPFEARAPYSMTI